MKLSSSEEKMRSCASCAFPSWRKCVADWTSACTYIRKLML